MAVIRFSGAYHGRIIMCASGLSRKVKKYTQEVPLLVILPLLFFLILVPIVDLSIIKQGNIERARDRFGFSAGSPILDLSSSEQGQQLDAYKALGARWVRFDFTWPYIQPNSATSFDWSQTDAVVNAANARGIEVLGYHRLYAELGTFLGLH